MIEKKTQAAMQAQQDRNRMNTELTEIKDHMDIKDRKINVLQRKVSYHIFIIIILPRISLSSIIPVLVYSLLFSYYPDVLLRPFILIIKSPLRHTRWKICHTLL